MGDWISTVDGAGGLTGAAARVWLVPLLPLLAALVITMFTLARGRLSAAISIAAILGSLGLSLPIFLERLASGQDAPVGANFHWIPLEGNPLGIIKLGVLVDNLAAVMLVMVCFIALLIQVYSLAYMETEIGHFPTQGSASLSRFYIYMSLFAFSMLGLVLSTNLLQIYIFWELVGACSFLLIGFWFFKHSAAEAAKKAFVVTRFADLGFLMGILMLGSKLESFEFLRINQSVSQLEVWGSAFVATAMVLIFCGAVGKSAQFPLQIWLPDAMEGPTPVSALIHAATMVAAGVFLVARMFPVFHASPLASAVVAGIGALTALMAATMALVQTDLKKVLAYSTISQLGFMLGALGSGAYTAGTFHLITHAFFKALLFLGAGAVIVACHTQDMWEMGGLFKRLKATSWAFLAGCLALAGIPPFAGFWSKDEILAGTHGPVQWTLILAAFLPALYVTRMFCIAFLGPFRGHDHAPEDLGGVVPPPDLEPPMRPAWQAFHFRQDWDEELAGAAAPDLPPACLGARMERLPHSHGEPHEVSPIMVVPLLILALFATFLGFAGVPAILPNYFQELVEPGASEHFNPAVMVTSILIAAAGVLTGLWLYYRDPAGGERRLRQTLGPLWTVWQQKYYMDHIWAALMTGTLYMAARIASWWDDNVVDRLVNRLGGIFYESGDELRREQTGRIQQYLLLLAIGAVMLILGIGLAEPDFVLSPLRWFRR